MLIRGECEMSPMTVSQASASEWRTTSDALLYILWAGSTPSAQVPMAGRSCTRSRGGTIPHVVDSVSNEGPRGSATRVLTCACRCVRLMPGSALRPLCMLCAGFGSLCKCFSALHKLPSPLALRAPLMSTNHLLPSFRATSLACLRMCLNFSVQDMEKGKKGIIAITHQMPSPEI